MTVSAPHMNDHQTPSLRAHDFFLARQPILDRKQELVAYELLFRNTLVNEAHITSDLSATAAVIEHTSQLGMEKVIGDAQGFINVDAAVLMSDIFQFLPRDRVVLEIIETMTVTPQILDRIKQLVNDGFVFALDDVITDSEDVKKLLPWVETVKFDLRDMSPESLLKLTPQFKQMGKKLLAEKVETQEQFQTCLDLGFDYFQGYYFARPVILRGKKLSPSQMAIIHLMSLVQSDADDIQIENTIKRDVTLSFNLLRLANSSAMGIRKRVDSLAQALFILGRHQLQRWLQIMLFAEPSRQGASVTPLLTLATTRGRLLELMAQKLYPGQRMMADIAFTVGITSLMDSLFGLPMEEILGQIPVNDEVADALMHRKGTYGNMLKLAEYLERIEDAHPLVLATLKKMERRYFARRKLKHHYHDSDGSALACRDMPAEL